MTIIQVFRRVGQLALALLVAAYIVALFVPPRLRPPAWSIAKRIGFSNVTSLRPGLGATVGRDDPSDSAPSALQANEHGLFAFLIRYLGSDGVWREATGKEAADWPLFFTVRERPGDLWAIDWSRRDHHGSPARSTLLACTIRGGSREGVVAIRSVDFQEDTVDVAIEPDPNDLFHGAVQRAVLRRFAILNNGVLSGKASNNVLEGTAR